MTYGTRKSRIFVLFLALTLGGIALFYSNSPTQSLAQNNNDTHVYFAQQDIFFNSLDQVIDYADAIVTGVVVKEEAFNDDISKYTLSVESNLKASTSNNIEVYELNGKMITGNSYILFLVELNHPLYSENSYTSFEKNMIINLNEKQSIKENKLLNNETDINNIVKLINKSDKRYSKQKKNYTVINKLNSVKELAEESDYILYIKPTEVIKLNKNVSEIKATILEQQKGVQLGNEVNIFLPSEVENEKEYIVFLKDYDGGILPTTRKGSIIEKGNVEFEEALSLFNNQ